MTHKMNKYARFVHELAQAEEARNRLNEVAYHLALALEAGDLKQANVACAACIQAISHLEKGGERVQVYISLDIEE